MINLNFDNYVSIFQKLQKQLNSLFVGSAGQPTQIFVHYPNANN